MQPLEKETDFIMDFIYNISNILQKLHIGCRFVIGDFLFQRVRVRLVTALQLEQQFAHFVALEKRVFLFRR